MFDVTNKACKNFLIKCITGKVISICTETFLNDPLLYRKIIDSTQKKSSKSFKIDVLIKVRSIKLRKYPFILSPTNLPYSP